MQSIVMVHGMADGKTVKERLILHSADKYPTFEGQECSVLDICLGLDQFDCAIVHGGADACIVTRFIKLAAPHQWQVSFHLLLLLLHVYTQFKSIISSANHSGLIF